MKDFILARNHLDANIVINHLYRTLILLSIEEFTFSIRYFHAGIATSHSKINQVLLHMKQFIPTNTIFKNIQLFTQRLISKKRILMTRTLMIFRILKSTASNSREKVNPMKNISLNQFHKAQMSKRNF